MRERPEEILAGSMEQAAQRIMNPSTAGHPVQSAARAGPAHRLSTGEPGEELLREYSELVFQATSREQERLYPEGSTLVRSL